MIDGREKKLYKRVRYCVALGRESELRRRVVIYFASCTVSFFRVLFCILPSAVTSRILVHKTFSTCDESKCCQQDEPGTKRHPRNENRVNKHSSHPYRSQLVELDTLISNVLFTSTRENDSILITHPRYYQRTHLSIKLNVLVLWTTPPTRIILYLYEEQQSPILHAQPHDCGSFSCASKKAQRNVNYAEREKSDAPCCVTTIFYVHISQIGAIHGPKRRKRCAE